MTSLHSVVNENAVLVEDVIITSLLWSPSLTVQRADDTHDHRGDQQ